MVQKPRSLRSSWTHQSLQDLLALFIRAEIRQDAPVDQNQTIQKQPGPEPEQSEDQGPPAGPHPEAQPPQQAQPASPAPRARRRSSGQHRGRGRVSSTGSATKPAAGSGTSAGGNVHLGSVSGQSEFPRKMQEGTFTEMLRCPPPHHVVKRLSEDRTDSIPGPKAESFQPPNGLFFIFFHKIPK